MQSEMKGCSAPDAHRMRQPIRMRAAGGLRGFIERLPQKIFARFGLNRHELVNVCRLQNRPQSAGINRLGPLDEFADIGFGHQSSRTRRLHDSFYLRFANTANVGSSPAKPGARTIPIRASCSKESICWLPLLGGLESRIADVLCHALRKAQGVHPPKVRRAFSLTRAQVRDSDHSEARFTASAF